MNKKLKQVYLDHSIDKEKIRRNVLNHDLGSSKPLRSFSRYIPLFAACLTLVILVAGLSTYKIVVDAKEYKKAISFFEKYDLSTDKLSKAEIKVVYRDISSGKFTNKKTADVIKQKVGGYEIFQNEPTSEDLENLWNYTSKNSGLTFTQASAKKSKGIRFEYQEILKSSGDQGIDVFEKSTFNKFSNNSLMWTANLNFVIDGYQEDETNLYVYGTSPTSSVACLAMLNSKGEILWNKTLSTEFSSEYIGAVLPSAKEIAVFSRGDLQYLCLSILDKNGNLIQFKKNLIGNYGIWNATRLGDGYLVQLNKNTENEKSLMKVNADGSLSDPFTYVSENESYFITDMFEFKETLYLSGYSIPKLAKEDHPENHHDEIQSILNYIFDQKKFEIPKDELTTFIRNKYTAVLLVCDTSSSTAKTFYSVKGSLGQKLHLSKTGDLVWDVESITDTFFSPATSSFSIGGASYIYQYTFDVNGQLLNQEKTGEVVDFRR